jgi:hypothetical protein
LQAAWFTRQCRRRLTQLKITLLVNELFKLMRFVPTLRQQQPASYNVHEQDAVALINYRDITRNPDVRGYEMGHSIRIQTRTGVRRK